MKLFRILLEIFVFLFFIWTPATTAFGFKKKFGKFGGETGGYAVPVPISQPQFIPIPVPQPQVVPVPVPQPQIVPVPVPYVVQSQAWPVYGGGFATASASASASASSSISPWSTGGLSSGWPSYGGGGSLGGWESLGGGWKGGKSFDYI